MPRKTEIGTEVAHVTRDSDTTFKVKGQLVADVLNSQHAGTGATWRINTKILLCHNSTANWQINANILSSCRGRRHIVSPRTQLVKCGLGLDQVSSRMVNMNILTFLQRHTLISLEAHVSGVFILLARAMGKLF